MSMPVCDIKNIMPNKVCIRLLSAVPAAALIVMMSLFVLYVSPAFPQEKKQDAKSGAGTSIEEERLKVLRADLRSEIDELKKLKQELEEQRKGMEGKKHEQLSKVVKMYEAMPPEEAARAIEKLDDDTAVQILTTLKPRSAGKVLAQIDPARAAALSKKALKSR
jgi:flagellar motility protein MotE (MotC chaperone)